MKDINVLKNNNVNLEKSLEIFGDMDTYNDMLVTFHSEIFAKIDELIKYKEDADMANYAILVHSLKSDAKYFGFDTMAKLTFEHEMKSKENDMFYVYENFENLMKEIKTVAKFVCEYLGENFEMKEQTVTVKDKKILVVDDSEVVCKFINNIFMDKYEVISVNDGSGAIENIKYNISIIFLDLNMPNVNGFAVLEYLKENNIDIPVVVMTGLPNEDIIKKAEEYSIIGILRKPFSEKDIKEVVSEKFNI